MLLQKWLPGLRSKTLLYMGLLTLVFAPFVQAAENAGGGDHHSFVTTLLWLAVILIAAKIASLIERYGQSAVLGELIIGVILGNLALIGIHALDGIKTDAYLPFLAELGVIILLFQVGLESNLGEMKKVGTRALMVAIIGVVAPFVLGTWVVGPWLMPGLDNNTYLFLGAALTATSVGITARVFKDLGKLHLPEAKIVLGAAVIDDVIGLIILAVVSALVTLGTISVASIGLILGKALVFLAGSVLLGQLLAPHIGKFMSKIHTGIGMKFTLAICFALIFAYVAGLIGLAPIVGAFAAGLVLDPVHFRFFSKPKSAQDLESHADTLDPESKQRVLQMASHHSEKHVEELIEPLALFLVPIFFVYTGMSVNLSTMFDPKILTVALGITVVAFIGKYISGLAAGNVNKSLVGFGMVPRGEVGLIFATIGKSLGVVNDEVFSIIVIMVILTTLLTPPILSYLLKRQSLANEPIAA
jgi:Kef-type K+ transport system membrane component KefB